MNTTILKTTAAPVWGPSACSRERFGIAPIAPKHGSGLPFGAGYGVKAMALSTDTQAVVTTLAAVRHDDARVPEPRGRKR